MLACQSQSHEKKGWLGMPLAVFAAVGRAGVEK
jgi:hypothetical protein